MPADVTIYAHPCMRRVSIIRSPKVIRSRASAATHLEHFEWDDGMHRYPSFPDHEGDRQETGDHERGQDWTDDVVQHRQLHAQGASSLANSFELPTHLAPTPRGT